jgi:hypothetical protein
MNPPMPSAHTASFQRDHAHTDDTFIVALVLVRATAAHAREPPTAAQADVDATRQAARK